MQSSPSCSPLCMPCLRASSPKITYRMRRTKFRPKYLVESFCQPRMCHNSTWSNLGLCVFDNNFSVSSPSKFFKFLPSNGDKCPQSKMYEFYHAWMGQAPRRSVQFLGVNFQVRCLARLPISDVCHVLI